jgi:CubicO group peptidase (beta-lactamase class C family)
VHELELTALLREHVSRHPVPGAALGVLRDGEMTIACTGVASTATGEPVTAETRFALGSLTKSMTATVVARLAAAGRLSLDDPIPEHVPELRGAAWADEAAVRDLLANRSRVPLCADLEFPEPQSEDEEALARVAAEVATRKPTGPFWSYANVGWALAGRVIETVTGLAWEDAVRAELLAPLGLEQTTFTTAPVAEPRATGHNGDVPVEPWTPPALAPAGTTLLSTVTDALRFAGAHLDDPALGRLRTPHAHVQIHGWFDAWCLGWAQFDCVGGPVWGWDGVISGQRSVLRLLPEQRSAVVLLTNGSTGRALYRSLFADLMPAMPELRLEPVAGAGGDLSRFAGTFAWPDRRWTVTATADRLVIEGDGRTREASPIDDRVFLVDAANPDNPTVTFGAFEESGRPGVLYAMLWGLPRV